MVDVALRWRAPLFACADLRPVSSGDGLFSVEVEHAETGILYPGRAAAAALRLYHRDMCRGSRPGSGPGPLTRCPSGRGEIDTPAGVRVRVELLDWSAGVDWAMCAVEKDGGDDT